MIADWLQEKLEYLKYGLLLLLNIYCKVCVRLSLKILQIDIELKLKQEEILRVRSSLEIRCSCFCIILHMYRPNHKT